MLGSSIICIDLLVRHIPHQGCREFRIQDSNVFLSSSLSLSFGVMVWTFSLNLIAILSCVQLFSSLYSMLPNAKTSLQKGGYSPKAAAWILIALFLAGVVGIQILSRFLHYFIPSHVVDCDHTHDDDEDLAKSGHRSHPEVAERDSLPKWRDGDSTRKSYRTTSAPHSVQTTDNLSQSGELSPPPHRPSFTTRVSEIVGAKQSLCDEDGNCFGLSTPCGQDCFQIVQARGGLRTGRGTISRSSTLPKSAIGERQPLLGPVDEESRSSRLRSEAVPKGHASDEYFPESNGYTDGTPSLRHKSYASSTLSEESHHHDEHHHDGPSQHHHHHVPENAFLSIGLQTCIAIALHKLPEGFITYATNHANPKLGFSVFVALFIHNITEGFAMALPLYLAIKSRPKAMAWAALLGGVSQPLGAGVAAIWFKLAGSQAGHEPGEGVYGGMFAIVAGIMTSVALQLFSESLDLTHNRNLCMAFAFVGMGVLGVSSALTA